MLEALLILLLFVTLFHVWFRVKDMSRRKKLGYSAATFTLFLILFGFVGFDEQIQTDLAAEQEKNAELTEHVDTLETDMEELETELDERNKQLAALEDELEEVTEERGSLQKKYDKLKKENKSLKEEITALEEEIEELKLAATNSYRGN